jgi:uncharacterized membrane protein YdjX (TVP38/TMEM64 family)
LAAVVTLFIIAVLALGTVLSSLLGGGDRWDQWWSHLSLEEVTQFIRSTGAWGIAAAIGLMVLHSFVPFPAEFVAIANGMIYGPVWGTVITWVGAMLGALLAFGLARLLGRPFVDAVLAKRDWRTLDDWVARHGWGAVLLSRFIPVISFNLINYAAGLTRIPWWTFTGATAVGILPLTTLMVVLGDRLRILPWQVCLVVFVVGLILWLVMRRMFGQQENRHAGTPYVPEK